MRRLKRKWRKATGGFWCRALFWATLAGAGWAYLRTDMWEAAAAVVAVVMALVVAVWRVRRRPRQRGVPDGMRFHPGYAWGPAAATALYRWYDAAGALLYVGVAVNPIRRTGEHATDQPWWRQVASARVQWFESRPEALDAEERAIRAERPAYNKTFNGPGRAA